MNKHLWNLPESYHDLSYEDLLEGIKSKVEYYLDTNPNLLFSHLYRLDIAEIDIIAALMKSNEHSVSRSLSILILDREIQKIKSKTSNRQKPIKGWEF